MSFAMEFLESEDTVADLEARGYEPRPVSHWDGSLNPNVRAYVFIDESVYYIDQDGTEWVSW